MTKRNVRKTARTSISRFLWLAVLVPILAVSAYSLYYVARQLGVPPWIAVAMSTCFDGVALLAANYSIMYAEKGLNGAVPATVVRLWALVAAYVQTLHAQLGHGPPGSWLLWASLPISAVTVYEIHLRWEKRQALANAGKTYPAPLPAFGIVTWLLFPLKTLTNFEHIVGRRANAIIAASQRRPALSSVTIVKDETQTPEVAKAQAEIRSINDARKDSPHTPTKHIRVWARDQGMEVSDRARLPQHVLNAYYAAHGGGS